MAASEMESGDALSDTAWLRAVEEIKQVKARYFRGVDTKDTALLAESFCSDVVCDFRGGMEDPNAAGGQPLLAGGELLRGSTQSAQAIIAAVTGLVTVHHGHMPEIAVTGPESATGIWTMMDLLRFPPSSELEEIEGWGFYHEDYRREDGAWRIARLRLERIRVDVRRRGELVVT